MTTPLVPFEAENALETAILATRDGKFTVPRLIDAILDTDIFVSSRTEIQKDGSGFQPLLVGDGQKQLVCVFSALSRPGLHRDKAEYVLKTNAKSFLRHFPAGYGIAINPGFEAQLTIDAETVARIKKDLDAAAAPTLFK